MVSVILYPKDGSSKYIRNFSEFLPANTDIMSLKMVKSTGNEFFGSHANLHEEDTYIFE